MDISKKVETTVQQRLRKDAEVTAREKALLWPILSALGVERKRWEKFKYYPDQLTGLIISCVKVRSGQIKSLKEINRQLNMELDGIRQRSMNFSECPFDRKVNK